MMGIPLGNGSREIHSESNGIRIYNNLEVADADA
jgi:hypothetical protein